MKVWKIRQYLPALACAEASRGWAWGCGFCEDARVCGVDRRCGQAVRRLMMSLVEKGLARRLKRGTYLIERAAVEEVLTTLKEWI